MWLTRAYKNSIQMHFPTLMHGHVFSRIIQSARCQRFISTDALAKHKADYRRNRKSRHFVDTLLVQVHAGHGGDGCVSFHREKFVQIGPAAGGNGGTGGNVYLRCDPTIHSLARVSKRVAATNGTHGEGDWLHGRSGTDVTIHVPVGTTVRSLGQILNEKSAAAQPYLNYLFSPQARKSLTIDLDETPEIAASRSSVWRHFPRFEEDNYERQHFRAAEEKLLRELRAWSKHKSHVPSVASQSCMTNLEPYEVSDIRADAGWCMDMDLPTPPEERGILLARGGEGGLGNPHFLLEKYHAPKIATQGMPGESLLLSLEYKQPSDIGLVGLPNAGKSTLLRCLSRADAEVGSYSFTTLSPNFGVMRFGPDGHMFSQDDRNEHEMQRLTVADMPGIIKDASKNKGLGHEFLRHIERCSMLVYVIDFGPTNPRPSSEVLILNRELEQYRPGLIDRVALVVANKADLLGGTHNPYTEEDAREKLLRFRQDVDMIFEPRSVPVIPISAKHQLNIDRMAKHLQSRCTL